MKLGRYEILEELGQGAMGRVVRARDPLIDRPVAIKTVPIEQLQQEGRDAEARFLREAQSAGRLSHPNIVTIYDVGEADGSAYIAMEFLTGATLREVMDKGPMPLDLALETAQQMADALAFAHAHGVIHRDVKPANVMISGGQGRIKLTDFGIAHLANSDHTQAGQMLGSPRYMSPEQAMGRELDGRSDMFSLGAVLYEMLTGHYAFDGDNLPMIVYRVIHDTPVAAATLRPNLSAALCELLDRLLSKDPGARPDARTASEMLEALRAGTQPAPAAQTPRRHPRPFMLLAVLGGLIAVGTSILLLRPRPVEPPPPAAPVRLPPPTPAPVETETEPPVSEVPAASEPAAPVPAPVAPPHPPAPTAAPVGDAYLAGLDKKAVELRIRRTELLLEFTEQHPDVAQIDRQLEQLRDERRRYVRQLQRRATP
jgi:serine/threonine-protein kinase